MMLKSKTRGAIGRRAAIAGAGSLLMFPAIRAQAQAAGVALVIGNSKYQWEAQLPNVRRDAPDIAKRFQAMGLKTELLQDAGRDAMQQAAEKFKTASLGAHLSAFYFAGHGVSWERKNYLVPVDADLTNPSVVQTLAPVTWIGGATAGATHRLRVYDNCRNNPSDGWRQLEAQRTAVVHNSGGANQPNTLVLYSTAPGRVAVDGPAGQNSPFAAALLRQLDGQSVDLQTMPPKLRRDLLLATEGRQVLWDISSYRQSFVVNGARTQSATTRSGWAADPSKIVELTNAYAFARENGLPLPEGLIAHRPANNSRDSRKVGSFKFVAQTRAGRMPSVMIVISVEEGRNAELIMANKVETGVNWRFITGTLSGDQLEFEPVAGGGRWVFSWSDSRSGSFSQLTTAHGSQTPYNTSFTRLDG